MIITLNLISIVLSFLKCSIVLPVEKYLASIKWTYYISKYDFILLLVILYDFKINLKVFDIFAPQKALFYS